MEWVRKMPRWARVMGGVGVGWSTLRAIDRYRMKEVRAPIMERAKQIALEPLGLDEMPRRVLVIYNSKVRGQVFFKAFVKPVLDAAALDYKTFDTAPGAAYDVAYEMKDAGGNVDGIIAMSTSIFREVVNGLSDRAKEQGTAATVPVGFIPTPHQYGLAKIVAIFDDTSKTALMSQRALDIAVGEEAPLTENDIAFAETRADFRTDRRRRLADPASVIEAKTEGIKGLRIFVPEGQGVKIEGQEKKQETLEGQVVEMAPVEMVEGDVKSDDHK